jgi:hypothetical protein
MPLILRVGVITPTLSLTISPSVNVGQQLLKHFVPKAGEEYEFDITWRRLQVRMTSKPLRQRDVPKACRPITSNARPHNNHL